VYYVGNYRASIWSGRGTDTSLCHRTAQRKHIDDTVFAGRIQFSDEKIAVIPKNIPIKSLEWVRNGHMLKSQGNVEFGAFGFPSYNYDDHLDHRSLACRDSLLYFNILAFLISFSILWKKPLLSAFGHSRYVCIMKYHLFFLCWSVYIEHTESPTTKSPLSSTIKRAAISVMATAWDQICNFQAL